MLALVAYDWPGNVTELENAIKLAAAKAQAVIFAADLPDEIRHATATLEGSDLADDSGAPQRERPSAGRKLPKTMEEIEREKIMEALELTRGNVTAAGDLLGYKSRQTMLNKMDKFGIPRNYGDLAAR